MELTELVLVGGIVVYTELSPSEVKPYLQGGSRAKVLDGYTDKTKETAIYINVNSIEYVVKRWTIISLVP